MKKNKITTPEMEIALANHFNYRQNIIVPNVSWGMGLRHECDLLVLSQSNYATEIEIKISKSDLLKDALKGHKHAHFGIIKRLFFAVPEHLKEIALKSIDPGAGLIVVDVIDEYGKIKRTVVRPAKINTTVKPLSQDQVSNLLRLSNMRIWSLKEKLQCIIKQRTQQ